MPLGDAFRSIFRCAGRPAIDARGALTAAAAGGHRAPSLPTWSASSRCAADSKLAAGHAAPSRDHRRTRGRALCRALEALADFESYFRTLKPKTRKNMRNARNRLERDGALAHHVADRPREKLGVIAAHPCPAAPSACKDQGLTSRAFRDPRLRRFLREPAGRARYDLLAMSLRHNDEPIAEQWGFVHQQRYYAFVASRDFEQSTKARASCT